jgi:hypothetical protein
MDNLQTPESPTLETTPAPAPTQQAPKSAPTPELDSTIQPTEPPRRLVLPWKLLMKMSLIIAIIPFLTASYFFFMSSRTSTASQNYYVQAQQYVDAGKVAEATKAVTLAEQNTLASGSAKQNAYIAVLILFVFLGDSLFLRHMDQKQAKANQEQL